MAFFYPISTAGKTAKEIFMKKRNVVFALLGLALAAAMVLTGCENPSGVTPPPGVVETTVSDKDLASYVPKPVAGETPATVLSGSPSQYTGVIAWTDEDDESVSGNFVAGTEYTAVVTLTPNSGYTFNGVSADSFTHEELPGLGITNSANSGVVTITFPATEAAKSVDDLDLTSSVTAPVKNDAPVYTAFETDQYSSGVIVWTKSDGSDFSGNFEPDTAYKAVVTLTAKYGYTFRAVTADSVEHGAATDVTNPAVTGESPTLTVTITFPKTAAADAKTKVTLLDLTPYITAPATGATPVTAINTAQYSSSEIEWTVGAAQEDFDGSTFDSDTEYTAEFILTAKEGFTFTGLGTNAFLHDDATLVENPGNAEDSETVVIFFPATAKVPLEGTVSIEGTAAVGLTLTANTSGLNGTGAFDYQWKRGDTKNAVNDPISGATEDTYELTNADRGKFIKVTVTRANNSGSITSNVVGPVSTSITIDGIDEYYEGKYATFCSSSGTRPVAGHDLVGMTAFNSTTFMATGAQISGGSVTLPVYRVNVGDNKDIMGDITCVPYTGTATGIKIYVIIRDSPTFSPADIQKNHGAYTISNVNFSSGSATGTAAGAGTVLSITGFDFPQASQGIMVGIFPQDTPLEDVWEDASKEEPEFMVAGASSSDGHITVSSASVATVQFNDRQDDDDEYDRWIGTGSYDVYLVVGPENSQTIYIAEVTFTSGINQVAKTVFTVLPTGGEYTLRWGRWDPNTYEQVLGGFSNFGVSLIPAGTNAGYLTSLPAAGAYSTLMSLMANPESGVGPFINPVSTTGSFAELVAFSNDGTSAPAALQTVLLTKEENVPILGVFQEGSGVIVFYIAMEP
jgi:hypothetical protein